jgi:hypothetical protein
MSITLTIRDEDVRRMLAEQHPSLRVGPKDKVVWHLDVFGRIVVEVRKEA